MARKSYLTNNRAEKYVAGQLLGGWITFNDPSVQSLSSDSFRTKSYKEVFNAARDKFNSVGSTEMKMLMTLADHFEDKGHEVIDTDWLCRLVEETCLHGRDIGAYINQLNDCKRRRKAIRYIRNLERSIEVAEDPQNLREEIIDATNILNDILSSTNWEMDTSELAEQIVRPPLNEFKWGYPKLDHATGGLKAGEVQVIGARPGNGKTSFQAALATKWLDAGKKVLFLSGEFPSFRIGQTIMTNAMGVNVRSDKVRKEMGEDGLEELRDKVIEFCEERWDGRLTIMDEEQLGSDPFQWFGKINHLEPDIVLYDYIQYHADGPPSKRARIGQLMQQWKSYAKLRNVSVVFAAQLNRNMLNHNREDPLPHLGDLEEAGAIEQYASNVLLLYNKAALQPGRAAKNGDFKVVLGKTRYSGGVGSVLDFDFNGELCRFNETQ